MAIKPYQAIATPVGHFDILDIDSASIKGGEVLVFDRIDGNETEFASVDVLPNDGYRAQVRLANPLDVGPFFLAANEDRPSNAIGFENTNLYRTNSAFAQLLDGSGKASLFSDNGFYAISSDVVDTTTISRNTPVYTKLYPGPNGYLTATPNAADECVGYFIEYQRQIDLKGRPGSIYYPGTHTSGDTIIIYKKSGHPSSDTDHDGYVDGYIFARQVKLESSYNFVSADNAEGAIEQISDFVRTPTYSSLEIPYASQVTIDFSAAKYQTVVGITGPLEILTANLSAVRTVTLFLESVNSQTLTFPGTWRWLTSPAPASLSPNTLMVITLTSRGVNDSDVVATSAIEA